MCDIIAKIKLVGITLNIISKRKTLAVITAAAVAAVMLTSCGDSDSSGSDSSAGASAATDLSIQNQKVIDSPEWLTKLDAVKDAGQIIVVAGVGDTTAYVSMHEKDENGSWKMLLEMPGYIGLEGMGDADCNHAITPIGTFTVGKAYGIADDLGCQIEYTKVTADDYWSGNMRDGDH